jgi:predicted Zn-dependent protease with MMP-like domain
MERSFAAPPLFPDTIFLFQEPLEEMCESLEDLEEQIEITVVHEIAHFFGISEERLAELGYE